MSRRDWFDELAPETGEHPVSREARRRLSDFPEYHELRARLLEGGGTFTEMLEGETRQRWLDLEADLNDSWCLVAEAYFNLGVEHGLAQRVVDDVLTDAGTDPRLAPAEAMRALARALARIAEGLR